MAIKFIVDFVQLLIQFQFQVFQFFCIFGDLNLCLAGAVRREGHIRGRGEIFFI